MSGDVAVGCEIRHESKTANVLSKMNIVQTKRQQVTVWVLQERIGEVRFEAVITW